VGGVLQELYMDVVKCSENYSVEPRSVMCSRESYCELASQDRVSVG
jgi:hypothetical protein